MFNYNTFEHDMTNRAVPMQNATLETGGGKKASLFVFSPAMMPTQVLRSYVYNFTPNLVDEIVTARDKMRRSVAPNGLGISSANVQGAILPDVNGVPIDTTTMSNQWTFVLIVDAVPPNSNRRALMSPTSRVISTGFCSEEPINPLTKTVNPNAVLMFTKSNTSYVTKAYGQTGMTTDVSNASDLDVVSEMNGMITPGTDLFIGTPQDIRSMVSNTPDGMMGVYGQLCLSNVKADQDSRLVANSLKTPMIQFGNIVNSLDEAVDFSMARTDSIMSPLVDRLEDPAEIAKAAFDSNVRGSTEMQPRNGLDISKPMTMQQLMFVFNGAVEVFPFQIPPASPWDATPQEVMSPRNQMSSMLSASLSNLVPACGIANITFRYASAAPNALFSAVNNKGIWELYNAVPIVPCGPEKEEANLRIFMNYFEMELTPILRLVNGEFDLLCHVDISGSVLLDLIYRDDPYSHQLGQGFYDTSCRLGGFLNPMVGTLDTINHNASQLDCLVTDTICKKIGPASFMKPIVENDPNNGGGYIAFPQAQPMMQPAGGVFGGPDPAHQPKPDYSNII